MFLAQWQTGTTKQEQAFDDEEQALRFAETVAPFDRRAVVVFEVCDE